MEIGIGLPTTIPGTDGPTVIEWARESNERGFYSLGFVDRVVWDSYDPIAVLGAAAAVTDEVRLTTAVLVTPHRGSGALLAKQLAGIDQLSLGRLTVGLAVGAVSADFAATGRDFAKRGANQDQLIEELREVWRGVPRPGGVIGPPPAQPEGPPLLIGGYGRAAVRRVAQYAGGWIAGGGGPEAFRETAQRVQEEWDRAGRDGVPYLAATAYYALGEHARSVARQYLLDYYGFLGRDAAERIADTALTDVDALKKQVAEFADAGCDELIFFPCAADADEIDLLARATLAPQLVP
ncbi:LLM class flavin-dependent oxidoreductase [Pseudonocardia sp. H11422]|uniref:LLM class flavin-dependent oxidoreductase n=1 Tax=Pseudonocardia sp. H11422 TaxID=2835866 RepID=UPI001BDCD48B|nr:LLM class flavin-dependent oxidoreductase [Pseudonocardia sp. H11422]